jgi:hypothetical protein
MFEAIKSLQQRLVQNKLNVIHGAYVWNAAFKWTSPISEGSESDCPGIARLCPQDYLRFLNEISNGCLLFYDGLYGQWGFRIFAINELEQKQLEWNKLLEGALEQRFVAFAELCGESHVLLFDLAHPSADQTSFLIVEANPLDDLNEWNKVSRSFHEWLEHLITAQGDKYWEWR